MATFSESATSLSDVDKRLLNLIQWDFPLAARPFAEIGRREGLTEEEVINRIRRIKDTGMIRQVSAIFDTRRLGYQSTLVAMRVEDDRIEQVANVINQHPGVSHNYQRTHRYNLWFTIAVPPDRNLEVEVAMLANKASVDQYLILPTKKLFKIGVKLDMVNDGSDEPGQAHDLPRSRKPKVWRITDGDIEVVKQLQNDIKLIPRPFLEPAERLGMSEEQLLAKALELKDLGVMRRFAAILRHRQAGFLANGMVCWRVPDEDIEKFGREAGKFPQVSHCYERPTFPDWPYNLYTMIHARTREACEKVAAEISRERGVNNYVILYSTREFKKERVRYFEDDLIQS